MINKKLLLNYLSNKRVKHSISTADFMKKHAASFGFDEEKSYLAGLLHDLAKELPEDEIIKLSESFVNRTLFELQYFNFKKQHPFLLHGVASAELMIRDLNINDIELLKASCHHTTGGINLSAFCKYTYLCDFCEPQRKHSSSKKIRKILIKEKNLDKAYLYTYIYVFKWLLKQKKVICPESIDGYNEAVGLIQ